MFKVKLINMPFAGLTVPSIALTQLRSALKDGFGDRVEVEILYLNHDFTHQLGMGLYNHIVGSMEAHNTGLGDWFFRQSAFPDLPSNSEVYFRRYFPYRTEQSEMLRRLVLEKRRGLDHFMGKLISKYRIDEAEVVGFTSMFSQNMACFAMARNIKERNPRIITVMGGANCESPMGQEIVKNVKSIDYVFSGPGLKSFPEFIQHCFDNEEDKCHGIRGVFSKKNYRLQPQSAIGEELSIDVPVDLNYDSFLESIESSFPGGEVDPTLMFETSRGCWWGERAHCTFCGLNGMSMAYRSMSPERAIEQFNRLFKYSSRVNRLESVDNILPKNYLKEVFPNLDTPPNMIMFYEVKADLDEADVQVLAKAGVRTVQPGIESLSTSTLKLMKKGTSAFTNLLLLKNCALHGVHPLWNLLIGFPREGEEVYKKYIRDIPLLTHMYPPSGVYPVRFDRYSPYFVQAKEYELDLRPLDFYSFNYPFDEESLRNLAYYFADQNVGAKYIVDMTKWIEKIEEKINPWVARWYTTEDVIPPRLYMRQEGSSTVIYDSRADSVIEYEISDTSRQVLEHLNKPGRQSDLTTNFGHIPGFSAEKEVKFLWEAGLLFEENDRYFSLVFPRPPMLGATSSRSIL